MKKLSKATKLLVIGVICVVSLSTVSAAVSATVYTFDRLGDGYNKWLSDKFTATYDKLYSKFKSTDDVNTTLTIEPKTGKIFGSSAGEAVFTKLIAGVYQTKQHTASATGKSYWIKLKNDGATVSGNYNIITSDVVQS